MIFGAISAGLNVVGGLMGANAAKKQAKDAARAAEFNPYNVTTSLGGATFDKKNNTVTTNLDPRFQGYMDQLGGIGDFALGGGGLNPFINFSRDVGNYAVPGLFGNAQSALGSMPGAGNMAQINAMSNLGEQGAYNFSQQAAQNPFLAQTGFLQGLGNQFAGNLESNAAFAQQDAFGRLNELARPGEERLVNQTMNRLANTGRLGFSQADSGTNPVLQSLFAGLGDAQTQRGLAAQQYGMNQRQSDLAAMGGLFGNAQGFFGQGLANQTGLGGLGLNYANLGLGANEMGFNRNVGLNELRAQRAMQQLGLATDMLGFGQNVFGQNLNTGLSAIGGATSLGQQELDFARLGGNIGGQQAAAGANMGDFITQQGSPLGGFLSSAGNAINRNATSWKDIFKVST